LRQARRPVKRASQVIAADFAKDMPWRQAGQHAKPAGTHGLGTGILFMERINDAKFRRLAHHHAPSASAADGLRLNFND
jgi:hypothetical protein